MGDQAKSNSISVVIVEDHEATLKGLRNEISAEPDIEVVGIATSGEEGLNLVRNLSPRVVLLDLHLPDSAGPKTLTEAYCAFPETKVLVFSGDTRQAILQIVLQTGVSGFLLKSEPIANIVRGIRDVALGENLVISSDLQSHDHPKLTAAEQHLLTLLSRGMKYQEIGALRVTSPETVRKQVDALLTKLNLESREELIAWAVDNGYGKLEVTPPP
jgi:DNA-binding NarL/FixJ family response regulator